MANCAELTLTLLTASSESSLSDQSDQTPLCSLAASLVPATGPRSVFSAVFIATLLCFASCLVVISTFVQALVALLAGAAAGQNKGSDDAANQEEAGRPERQDQVESHETTGGQLVAIKDLGRLLLSLPDLICDSFFSLKSVSGGSDACLGPAPDGTGHDPNDEVGNVEAARDGSSDDASVLRHHVEDS